MDTLEVLKRIEVNQIAALRTTQQYIKKLEREEAKPKRDISIIQAAFDKKQAKRFRKQKEY